MKKYYLAISILFVLSTCASFAQLDLKFGKGPGLIDYYNQSNHPGVEEPFPVGPLAFRLSGDSVWVSDSVGGKLIKLNKTRGYESEISVVASPAEILIEDFALQRDGSGKVNGFWLIDAINNKLLNFSVDGKKNSEIATDSFIQPFRVEVSDNGNVFVADKGMQAIFVFDPAGKFLYQTNWEWSGFAVAGEADHLYRLFSENGKTFLVSQDHSGDIVAEIELMLPDHLNPELWWVDEENQEAVLTYTPATGFAGSFVINRVAFDGEIKASGELKPPFVMNRFIDKEGADVWVGEADYQKAPEGCLTLKPFKMP